MEVMDNPIGEVHGDHEEFAMGKIDDLHHAEYQGEPDAGQGVNAPEENAGDE